MVYKVYQHAWDFSSFIKLVVQTAMKPRSSSRCRCWLRLLPCRAGDTLSAGPRSGGLPTYVALPLTWTDKVEATSRFEGVLFSRVLKIRLKNGPANRSGRRNTRGSGYWKRRLEEKKR